MHPLWGKYYYNHIGGIQFGKPDFNGNTILGLNLFSSGGVVAKVDSLGNTLWCKSYLRPRAYIHDCIVNSDGSFVIIGYTDSLNIQPYEPLPANFSNQLFMIKIDSSGNVLWGRAFDSIRHWPMWKSNIIKTNDGGFAILATVIDSLAYKPLLIKTNSNGDTSWTAMHGEPQVHYFTQSLMQASDNGYLLGGNALLNGIATWLYKTDSTGNTPCNMLRQSTITYPIFPIDSNVVLMSIDGASEFPVSLSVSTYPPRSVWDDCDYTSVPKEVLARANMFVFPNPTRGTISVDFENPLKSDCRFSIFDSTGRLVFQRILYKEKERIEVDLSPYGKGFYLLEFTEKDQVSVKKIVVE